MIIFHYMRFIFVFIIELSTCFSRIGQYVLINIPSIDTFAWHPFSISSAPSDEGPTTHHIKCMGPNEWTGVDTIYLYYR